MFGQFFIVVASNIASANNGICDVFYKTALFDEIHNKNKDKSSEVIKYEFCYAYNKLKSDKQNSKLSGNYEMIGGSASYGAEELESLGAEMCEKSFSSTMNDSNRDEYSKVVSEEGRKIVEACLQADTKGLRISTLNMGTEGTGPLTVALVWSPSGVKNDLKIHGITSIPSTDQLLCTGSLWKHRKGGKLEYGANESLNCANGSDDSVRVLIDTEAETLTFTLPPKAKPISNAHKKILNFIYDTPNKYDPVKLKAHTHDEFKSDLRSLTNLFNNFVDEIAINNLNQHFKFYKETYSDLGRAADFAEKRAEPINDGLPPEDAHIDHHLKFFTDFRTILSNLSFVHQQNNRINKSEADKFKQDVEKERFERVRN